MKVPKADFPSCHEDAFRLVFANRNQINPEFNP